ncbi:MAG TPA: hypothetical protein VHF27_03430 [Acidimicrobiales bacterium]|nr:hypothetical protein [Acidimicrobiales bacterium]
MRTVARLLLVALLAHSVLLAAPASAQTQDNSAVAVNTKDGKSVFKLAFKVKKVTGDVDATNTAVAYSSCTDCRTVAAAIQVVLVAGDADSATPENVAVGINYQCTECETLAAAYQFVFGDGQELEFTKEGKEKLHELKKRLQDLKKRDDLTIEELAVEIAAIAAEVAVVVDTETQVKQAKDAPATTTSTTAGGGPTTTTTGAGPPSTTTTTAQVVTTTTSPPTPTSTTTPVVPSATTTTAP